MNFASSILRGQVTHQRMGPAEHAFNYPMTFFAFNLDELNRIQNQASLFAYNRPGVLSLRDRDYLHGHAVPLEKQLNRLIPAQKDDEQTLLVTSPRYFGYAFNPVNFHLRIGHDGELRHAVAEVNNTFGDRHVYPLRKLQQTGTNTWTAQCAKQFHVSPFNNMEGEYHFTFRVDDKQLYMGVDLHRDGACVIKTWQQGTRRALTNTAIWQHALLHPFDTALNSMPRILWQAAQLYYRKKLQVYPRPQPASPATVINRDQALSNNHVV
ncbi:MAG: DUF1365 domain-containing protein [Coraliomargarita sp.]